MSDEKDLEKALSEGMESSEKPQVPKEQEIAYHQGALATLSNERNELIKMAQNVENVMKAHISRLEQLGVKIQVKQPEKK